MKTETRTPATSAAQPDAPRRIPVEPHDGMYVCPECGCWDIEGTEWVHLNTGRLVGSEPPSEDYWCPACEEHYDRVAILEADGTNAGDLYHPFELEGAEPAARVTIDEEALLDAIARCPATLEPRELALRCRR
jgi:hypothetical protein